MCVQRLLILLELGYARQQYIDLFNKGIISAKEMLKKIDELNGRFNKSNR